MLLPRLAPKVQQLGCLVAGTATKDVPHPRLTLCDTSSACKMVVLSLCSHNYVSSL